MSGGLSADKEGKGPSEHLVVVRGEVLRDAEHTLGNLFQRIYHATRLSRDGLGAQGDRLTSAVEDLEGVVELVFDYVSPVELELRPIALPRIAESIASQISARSKAQVAVASCPPVSVLADSRRLRRCFQLMGRACEKVWSAADRVSLDIHHDPEAEQVEILVSSPCAEELQGSRSDSLLWAVAGRLIDLHGGALQYRRSKDQSTCSIALPTSKDDDARV